MLDVDFKKATKLWIKDYNDRFRDTVSLVGELGDTGAAKVYLSWAHCVNLRQTHLWTNQYRQMVCEPGAVTWTNMGKEWSS